MSIVLPNIRQHLGASPISGSTAELEAVQKFIADVERDTSGYDSSVCSAAEWLSRQSSEAVDRLRVRLQETLSAGAKRVITSTNDAKTALRAYAAEVEVIHREARAVMIDTEMAFSYIRTAEAKLSEIAHEIGRPGLVPTYWKEGPKPFPQPRLDSRGDAMDVAEREAMISQMRNMYEHAWTIAASEWKQALETATSSPNKWGALWERRRNAEDKLRRWLQDTPVGHLMGLSQNSKGLQTKRTIALGLTGEAWGGVGTSAEFKIDCPSLRDLFGGEPGVAWWDSPPESEVVISWWLGLTLEQQEFLIRERSVVIGNLPGLSFVTRDRANRETLRIIAANPAGISADTARLLSGLQTAVETKLSGNLAGVERQIVSLNTLVDPPCAAMSLGNLDHAERITWLVAGMESNAPAAIRNWNQVGRNVFEEQSKHSSIAGEHAVAVWLGYDTPALGDSASSAGVLGSEKAFAGAQRLAGEIDGTYRNSGQVSKRNLVVNVGAHSYGVNTASIALTLTKKPVDSFTTFGSAGVDMRYVANLSSLHVREREPGQPAIYAVHAEDDDIAPVGAAFSGRKTFTDQPQRILGLEGPASMPGVMVFSAEGVESQGLRRTDGHAVIGDGNDNGFMGQSASDGHGYLDRSTQSLNSFARITSDPKGAEVIGGFKRSIGK
ncbi:hypothetical protein ICM05_02305 [Leucobacter sp. cx-42]|uniref:alpha/beta hydrolase n=1 Tax=unclassified Leucobacter TaxID=2621730 RepID=UPI00165E49D9|nr:hypothetical protein [Leucobacter sp. cx-42]